MVEILIEGPGKNALGSALIDNLSAQMDAADGAPLLFTGSGDAFSAGLNLKEVVSLEAEGMNVFLDRLENFIRKIWLYLGSNYRGRQWPRHRWRLHRRHGV